MEHIIKIVAVDDIKEAREYLAEKIECYMQEEELNYTLFQYESGEAFVAALEKEHFDIVFMDIFMEGMTGLDAAAILRKNDLDCKLVFLTTSTDFYRNGYTYNSAYYIVKGEHGVPIPHNDFLQAMKNCRIERQLDVPYLDVTSDALSLHINTKNLIYVDICDRNAMLHMTSKTLPVRRGFASISELLLTDRRFLRCFRGVVVNMDFVSEMNEQVFLLKNGEQLPFAARDKKRLEKAYMLYSMARAEERICKR